MPLLSVSHLSVEYRLPAHGAYRAQGGYLKVVDDVSFALEPGEILGLVGESGAGKTVACRAILRLLPGAHGRIASGRVDFAGRDIARLGGPRAPRRPPARAAPRPAASPPRRATRPPPSVSPNLNQTYFKEV